MTTRYVPLAGHEAWPGARPVGRQFPGLDGTRAGGTHEHPDHDAHLADHDAHLADHGRRIAALEDSGESDEGDGE